MKKKDNWFVAVLARMLVGMKNFFSSEPTYDVSGKTSNGRDAFRGVSAPRCHTQKKIYKGWAR
jgi:hypothetical protein